MKKVKSLLKGNRQGFALMPAVVFTVVGGFLIAGIVGLSSFEFRRQHNRANWERCYQVAENGLLEAVQRISEAEKKSDVPSLYGIYGKDDMPFEVPGDVKNFSYKIGADSSGTEGYYTAKATATIGDKTRTLSATIQYHPASGVFDYCYFLNNWGWFYGGSTSTAHGDTRSNYNFDFMGSPQMDGHIWANGNIRKVTEGRNGTKTATNIDPLTEKLPVSGWAGEDSLRFGHQGVRRQKMPNLKTVDEYITDANGSITVGKNNNVKTLVSGGVTEKGIYLEGSSSDPITINGTVVVKGDCVLSGVVGGTGTLYVQGNLYINDNVTYRQSPSFESAQANGSAPENEWTKRDQWVNTSLKNDKDDLVAYGVFGNVLIGDVNSNTWKNNCYSNSEYGLSHLGSENTLGSDGIRGTADDGKAYLDTNDDGKMDYAAYDADGDGVIRTTNYNYNNEIAMNSSRTSNIQFYPTKIKTSSGGWWGGGSTRTSTYADWFDEDGSVLSSIPNSQGTVSYSDIANKSISTISGVLFTNHTVAMYTGSKLAFKGGIICRDEAIVYNSKLDFYQDWRVHSRYVDLFFDGDGNKIIDLDLPQSVKAAIVIRSEEAPEWPLT
ncbi:hypothetical protein GX645_02565 [Candidatus Sumerlaeota bacterium]|nr:hypothetical protein [Candidatus Sumerlaeota bacterium]